MAEDTPYFNAIIAQRALNIKEDDFHADNHTVSIETQQDILGESIYDYINTNFSSFITLVRYLSKEDQELLLSYYLLGKTQTALSIINKATQTMCSTKIRMAMKRLGMFILLGEPTVENMNTVIPDSINDIQLGEVKLSDLIFSYEKTRSFQRTAEIYNIRRPEVRRLLSRGAKQLLTAPDSKVNALGAYLHGLIDKASAGGTGLNSKRALKQSHMIRRDPDILGEFEIDVQSKDFSHVLYSRANQ